MEGNDLPCEHGIQLLSLGIVLPCVEEAQGTNPYILNMSINIILHLPAPNDQGAFHQVQHALPQNRSFALARGYKLRQSDHGHALVIFAKVILFMNPSTHQWKKDGPPKLRKVIDLVTGCRLLEMSVRLNPLVPLDVFT